MLELFHTASEISRSLADLSLCDIACYMSQIIVRNSQWAVATTAIMQRSVNLFLEMRHTCCAVMLDRSLRQQLVTLGLVRRRRGCRAGRSARSRRQAQAVTETETGIISVRVSRRWNSHISCSAGSPLLYSEHRDDRRRILRPTQLVLYHGQRDACVPVLQPLEVQRDISVRVSLNTRRHVTTALCGEDVNSLWRPSSALITLTTRPPSTFNIGQLNVRSLGNKAAAVCDYIVEQRLDVMCIVESWHNASDSPSLIAATPPGYCYVEKARSTTARKTSNHNHGGICVFFRSNFKVRNISLPVYKTFEALLVTVHHGGISLTVLTVYRPPPAATD